MNKLKITVGLPQSGKSTWARQQGLPIVCPDAIRLSLHGQPFIQQAEPFVWAIAETMTRALFNAGHKEVVLDATNTTHAARRRWRSKDWTREYYVIGEERDRSALHEYKRRAACTCKDLDHYESLCEVIDRMASQYEPIDEGLDFEAGERALVYIPKVKLDDAQ